MTNYYSIYTKKVMIESLPQIVNAHTNDHEIYFITITFNNIHHQFSRETYTNYFKSVYQKFNKHCLNRPQKHTELKVKLILVPELSFHRTERKMMKAHHYHGFLMVHKDTSLKFQRNCIEKIESIIDNESKRPINLYHFKTGIFSQSRHFLKPFSIQTEKLFSAEMINKASGYATKKFQFETKPFEKPNNELCYDLTDIKEVQKPLPVYDDKSTYDNPYFSYDDVQLFCDISDFTPKNHSPTCINKNIDAYIQGAAH